MKRRIFISYTALGIVAAPLFSGCGASDPATSGSPEATGGEGSPSAPVSPPPTTAPRGFAATADTVAPWMAASQFSNRVRLAGSYTAGVGLPPGYSGEVAFYTDLASLSTTVVSCDPATGDYRTELLGSEPDTTGAPWILHAGDIAIDAEHAYVLVLMQNRAGGSQGGATRVDLLKIALADGKATTSITLWDSNVEVDRVRAMAGLRFSVDGSFLIASWGTRFVVSLNPADLSTLVTVSPDNSITTGPDSDYEATESGLVSLRDGSASSIPNDIVVERVFGNVAYGATLGTAEADGTRVFDLSSGQGIAQTAPIPPSGTITMDQTTVSNGYLVTCLKAAFDVRKPGDAAPLIGWNAESGRPLPASAAIFDGVLYACFEDQPGSITLIDIETDQDIATVDYPLDSVAQVSSMAAVDRFGAIVLATAWR